MTKVRLGNLCLAAAVAGVILCAVLMRAFYMPYSGFLRTVLYNILIFSWAVSVWWRILHAQTRRCLLGAAALMLFWLDIRLIRYDFAQTPEMLRRLWYAYYIPMLLIPTLALYTLFFLDRGQSAPLYKYRYMIFVFPVVLFSLVLTNDCHQLAFAFPPGQEVLGSPDYTYRFVYYLCLLWIFSCAVFTVVYLVRRCRIPHTKRILWLPLVPIFLATLYALLYKHILNVPWMHAIAGDMTVVQCLTFTASFEACIRCGLIQSNMGYATLFEVSMAKGLITDRAFVPVQCSMQAAPLHEEQLRQALTGSVQLDATTQLHGHPIRKGYIFWQEDITELVALLEELRLTQEELHDIGDIIQAETAQKAQWLKLSEQNRLYDKIETVTARQLARIQEYLIALKATDDIDTARRLLKHIVILGTYIKRRSNLVFVCDKAEDIDTTELRLSLFESAESLRLSDIRCAVQIADTAKIPPVSAVAIYDAFEAIIEATLPGLQEILFCAEHTAQDLLICALHIAEVTAETILVQFFVGRLVPEAAGVGADLVRQNHSAVRQAAKLQFEVDQADVGIQHDLLQHFVDLECVLGNGVQLFLGGKVKGQGVIMVDERVMQVVVLVAVLQDGGLEHLALGHAHAQAEVTGCNVADDDLQRHDLDLLHKGVAVIDLLHVMGGDALLLELPHQSVGQLVVDNALVANGALLLTVTGSGVILIVDHDDLGIVGSENLLGLAFVQLLKLLHSNTSMIN